jgi:hypothetical protein
MPKIKLCRAVNNFVMSFRGSFKNRIGVYVEERFVLPDFKDRE